MVQTAVLGYGTVGSGVVKVIDTNHDSILAKAGCGPAGKIYSGSERVSG